MRDSALKHDLRRSGGEDGECRRRAHARQRFETPGGPPPRTKRELVGEELMRDSALKREGGRRTS